MALRRRASRDDQLVRLMNNVIPYGRQSIDADDIEMVVKVLKGDWLTTGPAVREFEDAISAYVGGGVSSVSVTSGTAALHVAYAAFGIEAGDEVVTTPLTFVATAAAAALLGARVVFADIDPYTGNLDVAAAEAAITSKTRAIAAVDYAGMPVNGAAFRDLAKRNDSYFLQDAAHSIGSTRDGQPVGTFADITTFSFFPTKNMTTAEGGAVVTADELLAKRARLFHNHGLVRDRESQRWPDEGPWHQEVVSFGVNYRLPDVLAALGTSQLRKLAGFKARRAEIAALYRAGLADIDGLVLPGLDAACDPTWHLFPVRVPAEHRKRVFEDLREQGIGVQVNYIPVYWHPVFADLGYQRGQCPNAEEFYNQEISLPMYVGLTNDDVQRVVESVHHGMRIVTG